MNKIATLVSEAFPEWREKNPDNQVRVWLKVLRDFDQTIVKQRALFKFVLNSCFSNKRSVASASQSTTGVGSALQRIGGADIRAQGNRR